MSREVCGICWCPYDEDTGACACKVPSDCTDSHQPVAWRWGYRSITTGEMDWRGYVEIPAHPSLRSPEIIMEPLYTAPHVRVKQDAYEAGWNACEQHQKQTEHPYQPVLTDEIIADLWHKNGGFHHHFARAIERYLTRK